MIAMLIGEGPTDRALVAPIQWILREATPAESEVRWVEAYRMPNARTLAERIHTLKSLETFDLLFVHRDADNQPHSWRLEEIGGAAAGLRHVAVVPVRTTEAWLLPHESAIREACGRPSGKEPLNLPPLSRIEGLADPKRVLREAIQTALHVRSGRRTRQDPTDAYYRIADRVDDWAPLRRLSRGAP
jgi:hypothetical protein